MPLITLRTAIGSIRYVYLLYASFGTVQWHEYIILTHVTLRKGGPNGENLAQGYANVTDAVDAWGDERNEYDFNDPGFSEATGHFTQLVWKATTTVGCGRTLCNEMNDVAGWYVVCEYYPPGNVIGEFAIEVQGEVEGAEQCQQGTVCSGEKRSLRGVETWMWVLVILLVLVLS